MNESAMTVVKPPPGRPGGAESVVLAAPRPTLISTHLVRVELARLRSPRVAARAGGGESRAAVRLGA
jgi:hypothetical protein